MARQLVVALDRRALVCLQIGVILTFLGFVAFQVVTDSFERAMFALLYPVLFIPIVLILILGFSLSRGVKVQRFALWMSILFWCPTFAHAWNSGALDLSYGYIAPFFHFIILGIQVFSVGVLIRPGLSSFGE